MEQIRNADLIFTEALRYRSMKHLQLLLTDNYLKISDSLLSKSFRIALRDKNFLLLELVVRHAEFHKVNASFGVDHAIRLATRHNLVNVVKYLLKNPHVKPQALNDSSLWLAVKLNHSDIKEILIADHRVLSENRNNTTFFKVCQFGEINYLPYFLADSRIDPAAESNKGIQLAAEHGHLEIVKMLLKHPKVNPADKENKAFKLACRYNHEDVVRVLLKDDRVDPRDALPFACKNNNLSLIRFLLCDSRANNQVDLNAALGSAIEENHFEVVEYLLEKTRVNFSMVRHRPIKLACKLRNLKVLKRLVQDKRYTTGTSAEDVEDDLNEGLIVACKMNYLEIVLYLMKETAANPFKGGFNPIVIASRNGHEELVKIFLKDPRMTITKNALYKAAKYGYVNILKLLLKNIKEDITHIFPVIIASAKKNNRAQVVNYLSKIYR